MIFASLAKTIRRALAVKSARGVSFVLSALTFASKPFGYIRLLIVAWFFGTSPEMDAYHLAFSIVVLFSTSVGSAMQSALLPELERLGARGAAEEARSLFVIGARLAVLASVLLCAAFAIAPGVIVRLFAGGFDAERIRTGAVMLWWLTPYAVTLLLHPIFSIWAMFTEKYTISGLTSIAFNVIGIPVLLASAPLIGAYSVGLSTSAGQAASFVLLAIGMGGAPLLRRSVPAPLDAVRSAARTAVFSFAMTGMGAMYMVIDRYFASLLPTGAVAAISYGGSIITIITTAAGTPMLFFFTRISRAVSEDPQEALARLREAMAIIMAYFLPLSAFLAACARPITSIIFGWGSFDETSVSMTSTAVFAYCFGLTFLLMGSFVNSYAVAIRRLRTIAALAVFGIVLNTGLNWLLVGRYGLLGLAAATSISQCIGSFMAIRLAAGISCVRFVLSTRMLLQCAAVAPLALASWAAGMISPIAQLACGAVLSLAYLMIAPSAGLMPAVPEHWTPPRLASFVIGGLASYAGVKR